MQPKEGECFDKRGVPIHRGDLCRQLHFIGARRKKHWLYHVACHFGVGLQMVPVQYLDEGYPDTGGRYLLYQEGADTLEVIAGHGPHPHLDFNDRPRRKPAARPQREEGK